MPLGPTGYGDSPYQCFSAFAGNPYLISLDVLADEGFLTQEDLDDARVEAEGSVDYGTLIPRKLELLTRAYTSFAHGANRAQREHFEKFRKQHASWLDDYTLFMALKEVHGGQPWNLWDPEIRLRERTALEVWRKNLADDIRRHQFWQWLFFEQWQVVKWYAAGKDITIIGDIPIFIAYDSADAWANPDLFHFDAQGEPTVVAGVPPDYFSETGQRWGNPIYRWDRMAEDGFSWWIERFRATLNFFDIIRVDHFRGFEAYWEIPAEEPTAVRGRWVRGPGQPFFDAIQGALGELPIIAEDLGVITPEVEKLRDDNRLPGMKVLQFAFAANASDPYLPHNYTRNCVVYTGTHDNDTTLGWYWTAPEAERDLVRRYLARDDSNISWEMVRLATSSVADLVVVPLQDLLSLGSEARMNTPGVATGNWAWRFRWEQLPSWIAPQLFEMAELYGRVATEVAEDTPYRQSVTEVAVEVVER
jgi:4-alpha-glucanotransferase